MKEKQVSLLFFLKNSHFSIERFMELNHDCFVDTSNSKNGSKVKNASDEVKELQKTVQSLLSEKEALAEEVVAFGRHY